MEQILKGTAEDFFRIRQERPLIQQITNFVVQNETANITLCVGALPVMVWEIEEVAEMVTHAGGLLFNVGNITWADSMIVAGKKANELGVPVVLDPVGAGATKPRTDAIKRIISEVKIDIIRGNSAEIGILAGAGGKIKGVEAVGETEGMLDAARDYAKREGFVVSVTGAEDIVTDGERTALVKNGHPIMSLVTGTGCMSTTVTASFAAVQKDYFRAAVGALIVYGIAGEKAAAESGDRPGTFHTLLYDSIYGLTEEEIIGGARVELTVPSRA